MLQDEKSVAPAFQETNQNVREAAALGPSVFESRPPSVITYE